MVATRCPKFISATVRCMARVDLPVPPFSLPTTMTCAETDRLALASINMTPTCCGRCPRLGARLGTHDLELTTWSSRLGAQDLELKTWNESRSFGRYEIKLG